MPNLDLLPLLNSALKRLACYLVGICRPVSYSTRLRGIGSGAGTKECIPRL